MEQRAAFTDMKESTHEDWQLIRHELVEYTKELPDRVVAHLRLLEGDFGGFPVCRYTHSLQTATRALRDGRDEEYIVCALLHDIGDTLGTGHHPDIAAAILKPFVSEANHWMVKHHGVFQGHYFFHYLGRDRDMRDQFKDHPHYARTVEFCALYDSPAFDPSGETLPIEVFMPMLRRVLSKPQHNFFPTAARAEADVGVRS